ncbi:MAG: S24 family peptidase [Alphaproteobacteria bacterium]
MDRFQADEGQPTPDAAWLADDVESAIFPLRVHKEKGFDFDTEGLIQNTRREAAQRYFTHLEHICRARQLIHFSGEGYPKVSAEVGLITIPEPTGRISRVDRNGVMNDMSEEDWHVVIRLRLAHEERLRIFEGMVGNWLHADGWERLPLDDGVLSPPEVAEEVLSRIKDFRQSEAKEERLFQSEDHGMEYFLNGGYTKTEDIYHELLEVEVREETPLFSDRVADRIGREMHAWWRDFPIGEEQLAISGSVGLSIRSNLRSWREKTPLASNNGKPLSIRKMAEILGTTPVTLSRLETGKRSHLFPMWIQQYAHVLGVPEYQFFPDVPDLFPYDYDDFGWVGTHAQSVVEAQVSLNISDIVNRQGFQAKDDARPDAPPSNDARLMHMLDINQRKFEETTARMLEKEAAMKVELERAAKDREEAKFLMRSLEAKAEDRERLMEENHRLRQQNEEAFAGHQGQPVRETLPVYGRARAGQFDDILLFNDGSPLDFVGLPYNLIGVEGAFAVMCSGDSMSPKYENGDVLHCHPQKRVRRGHYIVVEWQEDEERRATIGRYLTATGDKVTLEKLNPAQTVTLAYRNIFRIVGSTEAED